jgi:hypothetical protein
VAHRLMKQLRGRRAWQRQERRVQRR